MQLPRASRPSSAQRYCITKCRLSSLPKYLLLDPIPFLPPIFAGRLLHSTRLSSQSIALLFLPITPIPSSQFCSFSPENRSKQTAPVFLPLIALLFLLITAIPYSQENCSKQTTPVFSHLLHCCFSRSR